jgi:hypothetical protein
VDDRLQLAGNLLAAATFASGLLLTFLGSAIAGYNSYDSTSQKDIKTWYRVRGSIAFVSFLVCTASAVLAFLSRWWVDICLLQWSIWLLAIGGVAAIISAVLAFVEIW